MRFGKTRESPTMALECESAGWQLNGFRGVGVCAITPTYDPPKNIEFREFRTPRAPTRQGESDHPLEALWV